MNRKTVLNQDLELMSSKYVEIILDETGKIEYSELSEYIRLLY